MAGQACGFRASLPGEAKSPAGATLALNTLVSTVDGLDSVFDKAKRKWIEASALRPGLTFHGLRKSLGKRAADVGFSELDIAAALGQTNPASSRVYTLESALEKGAKHVFKALSWKR